MAQIFNSPDRPFYHSTVGMGLYPLHEEIYYDFANRFFETKKGRLSKEIFHAIYTQFDGVTANIQQILNRLYEQGKTIDNEQQVTEAIQHIINRSSMQYEGLLLFLTDNQLSLLKAIAKTDCVKSPQAGEFIRQYELPSASSVKTALTVLVDKDLVYHNADGYTIYDHFFALWLKQLV
jgi:predicted transcriptional regulator